MGNDELEMEMVQKEMEYSSIGRWMVMISWRWRLAGAHSARSEEAAAAS
jgi:hypothetical protein